MNNKYFNLGLIFVGVFLQSVCLICATFSGHYFNDFMKYQLLFPNIISYIFMFAGIIGIFRNKINVSKIKENISKLINKNNTDNTDSTHTKIM